MNRHRLGSLLVLLQFSALGVLAALGAPAFWHGTAGVGAWLCLLAGVAVGLAAVAANHPGNFNIHPAPRHGGALVTAGIYRFIRHPMYSSVMLCAVAAAWAAGTGTGTGTGGLLGLAIVAALGAVLWRKAQLEEAWMQQAHSDYAAYAARTRRFVPGVL
jgi:protein-S-isoprenylcysteine O-methyltransferase Ste14